MFVLDVSYNAVQSGYLNIFADELINEYKESRFQLELYNATEVLKNLIKSHYLAIKEPKSVLYVSILQFTFSTYQQKTHNPSRSQSPMSMIPLNLVQERIFFDNTGYLNTDCRFHFAHYS